MARYQTSLLREDLPGRDWIASGLSDLANGRTTAAALATSMAAPRRRALDIDVPLAGSTEASHALYDLLASDDPRSAHSRYNDDPEVPSKRLREICEELGYAGGNDLR